MTHTVKPGKQKRPYRHKSSEDWKALVKQCDESTLSTAEFCQQHNIASSGLYAWRKRFSDDGKTTSVGSFVDVSSQIQNSALPQHETQEKIWDVELVLGQGCILRIRAA